MACFITVLCIGCMACKKACPTDAINGEKDQLHLIDSDLCIECESCGRVCPAAAVLTDEGLVIPRTKRIHWLKPTISITNCVACENCVGVCPTSALSMYDEHLPLTQNYAVLSEPKKCVSCNWCLHNCQYDAIKMEVQQ